MGQQPTNCQHCGEPIAADTYFCGSCGKPAAPSERPGPGRKHTIMGASLGPLPGVPLADDPGRTTEVGLSEPARGQIGRTMLGLPLAPASPPPTAAGQAVPLVAGPGTGVGTPERRFTRTMFGGVGQPSPDVAATGPAAVASAQATPAVPGPQSAGLGARTMLGSAEDLRSPAAAAPTAQPSARKPDPAQTMLGLDSDALPVESLRHAAPSVAEAPQGRAPASDSAWQESRSHETIPAIPRSGIAPARIAIACAVLVGAAGLAYFAFRPAGPEVRVRVVASAEGEAMLFEVPGVSGGAKIRFGGQEKPVAAGRVSFGLAPDSLSVGQNAVLYDLVQPSGEVASGRIALAVDYRVTLDTAPLRAGKAAVDVVVAALPGSKVWLDGQPVLLDAQGRALRSDPLKLDGATERIEHIVRYRVQPPSNEASVGELRTTIAVTGLQIDRPGALVVTDHDAVEIAGAVGKDTQVSIDGTPIEVHGGRFLYRFPLPAVGEYQPAVSAVSEGKAPRVVHLVVRRVADLTEAAAGFDADRSLTYAKLVQNPAIYRGQRVAFDGRVYNVNVEGGRSALQMLVRECPKGQRCPLWVSYAAATDLTIDSWVRVLGTVEGEQQFRAEDDQVKSVPKLEALFLLPAKP